MLSYTFYANGHPNLKGDHKTTLEFTKDNFLTVKGNCIVGINSDFDCTILSELIKKHNKFLMTLSTDKSEDSLTFYPNSGFNSKHEAVLRKTGFASERTLGTNASKASADLSREMIKSLNKEDSKIKVTIEPVQLKAVLFDFDDTLVQWKALSKHKNKKVDEHIKNVLKLDVKKFRESYEKAKIDIGFAFSSTPKGYSRKLLFEKIFKHMEVKIGEKQVDELVEVYWEAAKNKVKFYPNVPKVLESIRKQGLKIGVVTDSDGHPRFKEARMKKVGIHRYVDAIVVSDETGKNKPDVSNFILAAKKLSVRPEECIMIGDKPHTDLISSKTLGMTTVHFKQGYYVDAKKETFMDFQIDKMPQLLEIVERFLR